MQKKNEGILIAVGREYLIYSTDKGEETILGNNSLKLKLVTDPGMRDSDLDGIRDRLELGYSDTTPIDSSPWITTPSKASWTERIQRDPHHNMMKPEDEPIKNWVDTSIPAGGGEPSYTDPLNPDSDYDGLPDGWRDGWTYNPTQTPPEGQRTTNLNNMRYGGLNYWRYNESAWGLFVDKLDNKVQIYELRTRCGEMRSFPNFAIFLGHFGEIREGEDLNGNGKAEHDGHDWGFKTDTFESEGVDDAHGAAEWNNETLPDSRDSDGDEMGDAYEVWYSHIPPWKDGEEYILDPTTYDCDKDTESVPTRSGQGCEAWSEPMVFHQPARKGHTYECEIGAQYGGLRTESGYAENKACGEIFHPCTPIASYDGKVIKRKDCLVWI